MKAPLGKKIVAAMLIFGGIFGILTAALNSYRLLQQHWIYIVLVVLFFAVFIWSTLVGIRLWKNEPRGLRWAKILFAAQIPIVTLPGCSYWYYTGASFKIFLTGSEENFTLGLGSSINLYLDTRITDVIVGFNVIAVIVLLFLLLKYRKNSAVSKNESEL